MTVEKVTLIVPDCLQPLRSGFAAQTKTTLLAAQDALRSLLALAPLSA
jgi:hypothetical protein